VQTCLINICLLVENKARLGSATRATYWAAAPAAELLDLILLYRGLGCSIYETGPASRRFYLQQRGTPLTVALNKNQVEDQATSLVPANATESLTIRKSMRIKGEVIGSESLVIEGKVEGIIRVPNCRVTVGQHAEVFADIAAREVIVFGRVLGNVDASDRVDLRSEASLTGLVTTKRIQITEGAYFHGALNIIAQGQG
jgi:cytoskeletal protein CcmA (bactofilin family)